MPFSLLAACRSLDPVPLRLKIRSARRQAISVPSSGRCAYLFDFGRLPIRSAAPSLSPLSSVSLWLPKPLPEFSSFDFAFHRDFFWAFLVSSTFNESLDSDPPLKTTCLASLLRHALIDSASVRDILHDVSGVECSRCSNPTLTSIEIIMYTRNAG